MKNTLTSLILLFVLAFGAFGEVSAAPSAELDENVRFRCQGTVVSAERNPDGSYALVLQITYEARTADGRVYQGGGLGLVAEAGANPSGS